MTTQETDTRKIRFEDGHGGFVEVWADSGEVGNRGYSAHNGEAPFTRDAAAGKDHGAMWERVGEAMKRIQGGDVAYPFSIGDAVIIKANGESQPEIHGVITEIKDRNHVTVRPADGSVDHLLSADYLMFETAGGMLRYAE